MTTTPEELIQFATTAAALRQDVITPPTSVHCPSWCTMPAGHGFDSLDLVDSAAMRAHRRVFGTESNDGVWVDVSAIGTWRKGHEEIGPLEIGCWVKGNHISSAEDLTAAQALLLGPLLIEAGTWLARENAETQR